MTEERAVYEAIVSAQNQGGVVGVVTVISASGSVPRQAGSKMVVRPDGSIVGTIGGGKLEALMIQEALAVMQDGQPRLRTHSLNDLAAGDPGVCGGTVQVFIEAVGLTPTLIVIGLGHVGKALAQAGKWAGYRVVVCDDREAFCNPSVLPDMDGYVVCSPKEVADKIRINGYSYVAVVTRGLPVDIDLLPVLLQTEAKYIGVIGSRRRWALTAKALQEERGVSETDLQRIHAPIGLEIGAETPQEIAISILAEVIQAQRSGQRVEKTTS